MSDYPSIKCSDERGARGHIRLAFAGLLAFDVAITLHVALTLLTALPSGLRVTIQLLTVGRLVGLTRPAGALRVGLFAVAILPWH
jgi:hypothetical protein